MYIATIGKNTLLKDSRGSSKLNPRTALSIVTDELSGNYFSLMSTKDVGIIAVYSDNLLHVISSYDITASTAVQIYDDLIWEPQQKHKTFIKALDNKDNVMYINEETEELISISSSVKNRIKVSSEIIKDILETNVSYNNAKSGLIKECLK